MTEDFLTRYAILGYHSKMRLSLAFCIFWHFDRPVTLTDHSSTLCKMTSGLVSPRLKRRMSKPCTSQLGKQMNLTNKQQLYRLLLALPVCVCVSAFVLGFLQLLAHRLRRSPPVLVRHFVTIGIGLTNSGHWYLSDIQWPLVFARQWTLVFVTSTLATGIC